MGGLRGGLEGLNFPLVFHLSDPQSGGEFNPKPHKIFWGWLRPPNPLLLESKSKISIWRR